MFKTGLDVVDDALVISDIRNVERFYTNGKSAVTGYELWLQPGADVEVGAAVLNQRFIELYYEHEINAEAFTMQTIYPNLFGWLATHDVNALFISIIMIIVALLNMTTALLIIVLERQTMIGELRAMGMSRWSVVKVFVFRAMFIVMRGVGWGTLCGIALVMLQHIFGIMPLPAEGYILSTVPVAISMSRALFAGTFSSAADAGTLTQRIMAHTAKKITNRFMNHPSVFQVVHPMHLVPRVEHKKADTEVSAFYM